MKLTPFCPICGSTEFLEFNGRPSARCARCGAMERTRLLFGLLTRQGVLAPGKEIWHMLEHVPCALGPVLERMGCTLKDGGRMSFAVPIRRDAATTEDLDPALDGSERKARFGQHDHQRMFGERDALDLFRAALGPTVEVIDPLRHFTVEEIRTMGILVDVEHLSGHSIFCYRYPPTEEPLPPTPSGSGVTPS